MDIDFYQYLPAGFSTGYAGKTLFFCVLSAAVTFGVRKYHKKTFDTEQIMASCLAAAFVVNACVIFMAAWANDVAKICTGDEARIQWGFLSMMLMWLAGKEVKKLFD